MTVPYDNSSLISNKIITADDLRTIFKAIEDCRLATDQRFVADSARAEQYGNQAYKYRTMNSYRSKFGAIIAFRNSTRRDYNNYRDFIDAFNGRLTQIDHMMINCSIWYYDNTRDLNTGSVNGDSSSHSASISLHIDNAQIKLGEEDSHGDGIFTSARTTIMTVISNAPERYDHIIKDRQSIQLKIGAAAATIPCTIVTAIIFLLPSVRAVPSLYLIYPAIAAGASIAIGATIGKATTEHLYAPIIPRQKYVGYDKRNYAPTYTDNVDEFTNNGEICFGKYADNVRCRQRIARLEEEREKPLSVSGAILIITTILVYIVSAIV